MSLSSCSFLTYGCKLPLSLLDMHNIVLYLLDLALKAESSMCRLVKNSKARKFYYCCVRNFPCAFIPPYQVYRNTSNILSCNKF